LPVDPEAEKINHNNMKKIFTLIAATLFTLAIFAADRKPVVTLKSNKNYEVVIDGQTYFASNGTMNIANLRSGQHTIKVYETSRGFGFRKNRKLVESSTFMLRKTNVDIIIGLRGHINIDEDNRFDRNGKNDRDWDNQYGRDKKDDRDRSDIPRRF
jgi:hypothetical protein